MAKLRTIGDHTFRYYTDRIRKWDAQQCAQFFRDKGRLARVIPRRRKHGTRWVVWVGDKKP